MAPPGVQRRAVAPYCNGLRASTAQTSGRLSSAISSKLAANRQSTRLWRAIWRLVEQSCCARTLSSAFAAWAGVAEDVRKRRRDALFDSISNQLRVAKRQCMGLEKQILYKEPLFIAFRAWRSESRVLRIWQLCSDVLALTDVHASARQTAFAAMYAFSVWRGQGCTSSTLAATPSGCSATPDKSKAATKEIFSSRQVASRAASHLRSHSAGPRGLTTDDSDLGALPRPPEDSPTSQRRHSTARGASPERCQRQLEHPSSRQACNQMHAASTSSLPKRSRNSQNQTWPSNAGAWCLGSRRHVSSTPSITGVCLASRLASKETQTPQAQPAVPSRTPTPTTIKARVEDRFDDGATGPDSPVEKTPSKPVASLPHSGVSTPTGISHAREDCGIPDSTPRHGPERFFYDRGSYTGCARFGGPSVDDRVGASSGAAPERWQGGLRDARRRWSTGGVPSRA